MCGIAGIIQPEKIYTGDTLSRMTASLAHRGPDGEALWQNEAGTVLLGHRRLAIIDLSPAAAQPMHFTGKNGSRYTIVYNGEIYNYIELGRQLQNEGYVFHTRSDTEVLLAAYDYWGEECVQQLDGMFAFAIWDEEAGELFAARDRFGEKPFFYWCQDGIFLFASEMKALWQAGVSRIFNQKMLFNFLTIGYTDNPERQEETFFENINKLPAASRLYFSPGSPVPETEKYWELDPEEQNVSIKEAEAVERFTHLLQSSVRRRLRADVATGTSLSGGLDSATIAAWCCSLNPDSTYAAFTASFPGFEKDESVQAAAVAAYLGLHQKITAVTAADLEKSWQVFMYHQEEPVASASAFAQFRVFELAKENSVTVLLDGQGADEILAGYHKYYKWYWQELFLRRKLLRSKELKAARSRGITEPFGFKNIIASLFPDLAAVVLERQYLVNALRHQDLTTDFVRLQSKEAYYTTPALSSLNGYLHFNTCVHGLEELLRYADRSSMAWGREVRLPFLDHELVSFVFSLPGSYKIHDGWTKWLLRKAMDKKLPGKTVWQPLKTGFEPPQKEWMQHKAIAEMIQESKRRLVSLNILRPAVLDRPPVPASAYEKNTADWRYLAAAACL